MDRLTGYTGYRYEAYDPIDTKNDFSETNLQKLIDKLAHYEDLEESGRLVVLPCEVGDYIYDISEFTDENEYPEMIVVRAYYIELSLDADGEINYCIAGYDYKKEDFGKTVFRTIEEAEAALKGGGQDE